MNTVRTCLITVVLSANVANGETKEKFTCSKNKIFRSTTHCRFHHLADRIQSTVEHTVKCRGKACTGDDKSVNTINRLSSVFRSVPFFFIGCCCSCCHCDAICTLVKFLTFN